MKRHFEQTLKSLRGASLFREDRIAPEESLPVLTDRELMGYPYPQCLRTVTAHTDAHGAVRVISTAVQVGAFAAFSCMKAWGIQLNVEHADLNGVEQMKSLPQHTAAGEPAPFTASPNDPQHFADCGLPVEYKYLIPTTGTMQRLLRPLQGSDSGGIEKVFLIERSTLDAAHRRQKKHPVFNHAQVIPCGLSQLIAAATNLRPNEVMGVYSPFMERLQRRLRGKVELLANWGDVVHYGLYAHESWLRDDRLKMVVKAFAELFVAAWVHCSRDPERAFRQHVWTNHDFLFDFAVASDYHPVGSERWRGMSR